MREKRISRSPEGFASTERFLPKLMETATGPVSVSTVGAHGVTKAAGYFTQDFVAGSMAESVVHFSEVINVAQNYGHSAFFAVAARACDVLRRGPGRAHRCRYYQARAARRIRFKRVPRGTHVASQTCGTRVSISMFAFFAYGNEKK